jgi:hypothetical protein
MINDRQVKIRLGKDKKGTPRYGNLGDMIISEIPTQGDLVDIGLGADAQHLVFATAPTGNIYLDGSTYEGINGGIACATVTIGTPSTATVNVGGRFGNMTRLLDKEDDEVLDLTENSTGKVIKRRYVYALWGTDLAEGEAITNSHLQVSFVAWDDTTDTLELVTVPAGDYKANVTAVYNSGTIAIAKRLGNIKTDFDLGGYTQDDLLDLTEQHPMELTIELDAEADLQADQTIIITLGKDAANSSFADSAGNIISGTKSQEEVLIFDTTDIGKPIYGINGGILSFNGVLVRNSKVTVEAENKVKVVLDKNLVGVTLYRGNYFTLAVQGV